MLLTQCTCTDKMPNKCSCKNKYYGDSTLCIECYGDSRAIIMFTHVTTSRSNAGARDTFRSQRTCNVRPASDVQWLTTCNALRHSLHDLICGVQLVTSTRSLPW